MRKVLRIVALVALPALHVACNGRMHSLGTRHGQDQAGGGGEDSGGATGIGGALGKSGRAGSTANGGASGNAAGVGGASAGMDGMGGSPGSGGQGVCEPGERQCDALQPRECDGSGEWQDDGAACPYVCASGRCIGECSPTTTECFENGVRTCNESGQWGTTAACALHQTCMSGVCGGGKLLAADGAASDGFGESVSVNRDTLFVGAMGSAQDGVECGSAYVYTRTGSSFTQQQKLNPSDCATDDWFGLSVSVSDDTAVVGAPHGQNDHGPGSAYVFTRTGSSWTQQQKLLAGDDMPWNAFGISVSVSGDTTVVGAHWDSDNGIGAGSAYVFTRTGSTWTQQQKLLPDDGAANDKFGISVSLSGDTAVIGVYNYDTDRGAAYVFTRTGSSFIQQQKLVPDDGPGDDFGLSVSVSGATAVIGARLDDDNGTNSGAAYVFTRTGSNFTQQQKLVPDDAAAGKGFGHQVSLSGDTVVVASGGTDDNGTNTGSAYVFTRTGSNFTQRQKLLPGDGAAGDYFGYSLSVSGRTAVVSSYGDDDNGSHAGSVYVFALPAP